MRIFIMTILGLVMYAISGAQVIEVKYFKDEWASKEVNAKKAKYSQTITQNSDGSITRSILNLANNRLIKSETYKEGVAYGIWTDKYLGELDYNFDVEYVNDYCNDSIPGIVHKFINNDSLHYIAPVIKNFQDFNSFLIKSLTYPTKASMVGISGRVLLAFTITETGAVENVVVLKGVDIHLDKEAVRVLRKLAYSNPPMLNGKPYRLCVIRPISFTLQ